MSNKGKGVKVSAAFSSINLPHQPPYSKPPLKWERREPEDKGRKNPVRTYWRRNEVEKDDIEEEEEVQWWEEQNVGYNDESEDEHDITWDDDLKKWAGDDDNNDGDERRE